MKQIRLIFEKGGALLAVLDEERAPKTSEMVWEAIPFQATVTHSRWSGREVNFETELNQIPPRENQSIYTSLGDLCYWRDWRKSESKPFKHVLAVYYGPEMARSHMGEEPVNIIGSIIPSSIKKLNHVGERIWKEGFERVRVEKVELDEGEQYEFHG